MTIIYKICDKTLWAEAEAKGQFDGAPVDLADGYIHFSTGEQARETAAKHFAGQSDLFLISFDSEALGEKLVWEPSRGGALFPHLYRSFKVSEALSVVNLPLDENGAHVFPNDVA